MSKVDNILAVLPTLNSVDLNKVKIVVEGLLNKTADADNELFYIMFDLVGEKLSYARFKTMGCYSQWVSGRDEVNDLIKKIDPENTRKKPVDLALKKYLMELIIEDIKQRKIDLTLSQICTNMNRAGAVFEQSFPGYITGGVAHMVLKRLGGVNGKNKDTTCRR